MTTDQAVHPGGIIPVAVRAAVLTAPGTLELRSFPLPTLRPDTGLVAVELCGICGTDLKYASGRLAAPLPMILGHEIVGRITGIGDEAAARWGVTAGDRVLVESSIPCWSCEPCRAGAYRLCPTKGGYGTRTSTTVAPGLWGGLAEQMWLAPGSIVHRVPELLELRAALAVPLLANGLQWLVRAGGAGQGDRILIQGCGPQGLAAALVAGRVGASEVVVTGLASDEARLAFAAAIGVRTVVVDPGWSGEVRLEAIGREFDVVLDVSGSPSAIAGAPAHLRPMGTFVLAGLIGRGVTVPFATDELAWREIRVQGVLARDAAAMRAALAVVVADRALADRAAALTTHVFPLESVVDALGARQARLPGFVKAAVAPAGWAPEPPGSGSTIR